MLELRDFRLVSEIARHGSLVRAGRVLGVTASGVTRAVAALEARLGVRLFERSRHGAEPTDICRAILARAQPILASVEALNAEIGMLPGAEEEELGVATGALAMETVVAGAAAAFLPVHPKVRLAIHEQDAIQLLLGREVSIAVLDVSALDEASELRITPLRRHPILVLARPDHPLLSQPAPVLTDIVRYPLVTPRSVPTRLGVHLARAREAAGEAAAAVSCPAARTTSLGACLAIACRSDAVVAATAAAAATYLRAGLLSVVPWHEPWLVTNFAVLTLRNRRLSAAGGTMLDLLQQEDAKALALGRTLAPERAASIPEEFAVAGAWTAPAFVAPPVS
jgi:DNA-binding transcriptional LysR family regulator